MLFWKNETEPTYPVDDEEGGGDDATMPFANKSNVKQSTDSLDIFIGPKVFDPVGGIAHIPRGTKEERTIFLVFLTVSH
ncbi:unnamed protein product [Gongylonema pulchrum]|uniref:UDENN domain-containing protein n=1 Tax=Gongylonema pulchrum TaxID=637853 RepID=A0A183D5T6_9BILA|nr:unnamed protein product [Gongylonema pulchrum]